MIKLEGDIRNHIGKENQFKLLIDEMKLQIEDLQYDLTVEEKHRKLELNQY